MGVDEIAKAPGEKCVHVCPKGCDIYQFRPNSCREFECVWLQLSDTPQRLPKKARPDRSGVMFVPSPQPDIIAAHCKNEASFENVRSIVNGLLLAGIRVVRIVGDKRTLISLKRLQ